MNIPCPMTTSVVMATYNGERHLDEQLASLANQTCLPDELIISDDGSSDRTQEIIQSFVRSSPLHVRLQVNPQRLGYARNFMSAANQAQGDLILFCDHDDIWHPEKIAVVRQAAQASGANLISHDIRVFHETPASPEIDSYFRLLCERGFSPSVCFKGCSLAVRRSFLDRFGWPPESSSVSHDFWLALLATALGERHYIEQALVSHRIHGRNASGWIASRADRVGTRPGGSNTETELLIDLCIKRKSLSWTHDFLRVIRRSNDLPPTLADAFEQHLIANWNLHQTPKRRVARYLRERLHQARQFSRRLRSCCGLSRA
jgi:glycosyltransferase involved in cell wall biosynthesis